jgi:hypothetical protein
VPAAAAALLDASWLLRKTKTTALLTLGTAGACTDQVAELLVRQRSTLGTVYSTAYQPTTTSCSACSCWADLT